MTFEEWILAKRINVAPICDTVGCMSLATHAIKDTSSRYPWESKACDIHYPRQFMVYRVADSDSPMKVQILLERVALEPTFRVTREDNCIWIEDLRGVQQTGKPDIKHVVPEQAEELWQALALVLESHTTEF